MVDEKIKQRLSAGSWAERKAAIDELLAKPEDEYIPLLEKALEDHSNANFRNASMEAYKIAGIKALSSLMKLLRHDDEEVRLFSVNILGEIGDKLAFKGLLDALGDDDVNVRIAAAESLGKIGDQRASKALRMVLKDNEWVSMAAINALALTGGSEALDALYECIEGEIHLPMVFDALEKIGDQNSIRVLTKYVEDPKLKELALKAIISISDRVGMRPSAEYFFGLVPLLIELQASPKEELRNASFVALSWARDVRSIPYMINGLGDEALQEYAVKGLIDIGKMSIPLLIDKLRDTKSRQRSVVASIVSMIDEKEALVQFATDEDPEVRVEVALALGSLRSERVARSLKKLAEDPEEEVRAAALGSLRRMEDK